MIRIIGNHGTGFGEDSWDRYVVDRTELERNKAHVAAFYELMFDDGRSAAGPGSPDPSLLSLGYADALTQGDDALDGSRTKQANMNEHLKQCTSFALQTDQYASTLGSAY